MAGEAQILTNWRNVQQSSGLRSPRAGKWSGITPSNRDFWPIRAESANKGSLGRTFIMQNKANLPGSQMNVNILLKKVYENETRLRTRGKQTQSVRPALSAKELPDWSNPIFET